MNELRRLREELLAISYQEPVPTSHQKTAYWGGLRSGILPDFGLTPEIEERIRENDAALRRFRSYHRGVGLRHKTSIYAHTALERR
jgi:hypothetical protein